MEPSSYSQTAIAGAFVRAYHFAHDDKKIFADSLAQRLLTREEREAFESFYINTLAHSHPELVDSSTDRTRLVGHAIRAGVSGAIFLARARYIEQRLAEAIGRGIHQYVLIGAGLDTYAFRRPAGEQLQIFELDHPGTQSLKRDRLAQAGLAVPMDLHFVPTDLEQESLAVALARTPFDSGAPAFIAWPGVTMYLTREAIHATLQSVRHVAAGGSELVFDYLDADAFTPDRASDRLRRLMEYVRSVNEPMLSGFEPAVLVSALLALRFHVLEDLSPPDVHARYFQDRSDGFRAAEHFHFVHARVQ